MTEEDRSMTACVGFSELAYMIFTIFSTCAAVERHMSVYTLTTDSQFYYEQSTLANMTH